MANNTNTSNGKAAELQAAIAGILRFATVNGGRANFGNAINRAAYAQKFPGINLADALVAGHTAKAFTLTGADMRTVLTPGKIEEIKARIGRDGLTVDQRKAQQKTEREAIKAKINAVKFGNV